MNATHTPGPWKLADDYEGSNFKLTDADGEYVTYLAETRYVDEREDPEAVANARLIAAAPELLATLREAVEMCELLAASCSDRVHNTDGAIAKLRAVLAKADGKA